MSIVTVLKLGDKFIVCRIFTFIGFLKNHHNEKYTPLLIPFSGGEHQKMRKPSEPLKITQLEAMEDKMQTQC